MRTKLVYIMEREDVEVLKKAKGIINLLYNAEVEYDNDAVEEDLANELIDIEDMCIDEVIDEKFDEICQDFDDDREDDEEDDDCEDEPVAWCEYCGCPIYEDDYEWIAADGSVCCCDECVVEYNRENFPEDDEEDE